MGVQALYGYDGEVVASIWAENTYNPNGKWCVRPAGWAGHFIVHNHKAARNQAEIMANRAIDPEPEVEECKGYVALKCPKCKSEDLDEPDYTDFDTQDIRRYLVCRDCNTKCTATYHVFKIEEGHNG